jgi:hypothetical protein
MEKRHKDSVLWQAEARKIGGDHLVTVIEDIRIDQNTILDRLTNFEERHKAAEASLTSLQAAFPAGDAEAHRRYHDALIRKTEETRRLRVAITEKTISGLLWTGIVSLGIGIWQYIKIKLNQP